MQRKDSGIDKSSKSNFSILSIGNPGMLIEGFGDVVVRKDECDEEIVVCDNFEVQTIDETAIEIIGDSQNWQWIDGTGKIFTTNIGEPCIYDESPEKGHGMTKALIQIPYFNNAHEPIYNIFEDMRLAVCLDTRDMENIKWQFDVYNIRIPIYMSLCPREGWIDLGDGTDNNLLGTAISDCSELDYVINWLDTYWIPGQHLKEHAIWTPNKYCFSAGTLINEEYHVDKLKNAIIESISDTLVLLRSDEYKFAKEDYPCPEDVINAKEITVRSLLQRGRNGYIGKMDIYEQEEINSDDYSRPTFRQIRLNILSWAKQQDWWDSDYTFCKDAISGHNF